MPIQLQRIAQFKKHVEKDDYSKAMDTFRELKRWPCCHVHLWNLAIDLHGRLGRIHFMQPLYREMLTHGIVPSANTFELMMDHYYDNKAHDAILAVMEDMVRHNIRPRYPTLVYVLQTYARRGDARGVKRTFQHILDFRMRPDLSVFNAVLDVYAKEDDLLNITRAVDLMKRFEVEADRATFDNVINPLVSRGRIEESRALLTQMQALGFEPHAATFSGVLSELARNNSGGGAIETVMALMAEYGVSPDAADLDRAIATALDVCDTKDILLLHSKCVSKGRLSKHTGRILRRLARENDHAEALLVWEACRERLAAGADASKAALTGLAVGEVLAALSAGDMVFPAEVVRAAEEAIGVGIKISVKNMELITINCARKGRGAKREDLVKLLKASQDKNGGVSRGAVDAVMNRLNDMGHHDDVIAAFDFAAKTKRGPSVLTYEELLNAHVSLGRGAVAANAMRSMSSRARNALSADVVERVMRACAQEGGDEKELPALAERLNEREAGLAGRVALDILSDDASRALTAESVVTLLSLVELAGLNRAVLDALIERYPDVQDVVKYAKVKGLAAGHGSSDGTCVAQYEEAARVAAGAQDAASLATLMKWLHEDDAGCASRVAVDVLSNADATARDGIDSEVVLTLLPFAEPAKLDSKTLNTVMRSLARDAAHDEVLSLLEFRKNNTVVAVPDEEAFEISIYAAVELARGVTDTDQAGATAVQPPDSQVLEELLRAVTARSGDFLAQDAASRVENMAKQMSIEALGETKGA